MQEVFKRIDGLPCPLGATPEAKGTHFAVYAGADATSVTLCLFDKRGTTQQKTILMDKGPAKGTGFIWHAYVPKVKEGAVYGYRVDGPFDPEHGKCYNPNKLLCDPYACDLVGQVTWNDVLFPYQRGNGQSDLSRRDERDSAPFVPKGRVVDRHKKLQQAHGKAPGRPLADDATLEAHVKGFTCLYKDLPEKERGTFKGLANTHTINWLKTMHINSLEFMPATEHVDDERFAHHPGLTNYWGYMPFTFFPFHREYAASGDALGEVMQTLKTLRANGIEPVLDVVFNHTAEGGHGGPSLAFRGFDGTMYHGLPHARGISYDTTGCGNTLDASHPFVQDMIIDALEYYMALGFTTIRFDLGVALGREGQDVAYKPDGSFFTRLRQEIAHGRLQGLKITGEPWDLGPYGQQQGNTPFAEWNDQARHAIQEAALSPHGANIGKLSAVLAEPGKVNAVFTHDGSTVHDLTAFSHKNNWANGENNQDGSNEPYRHNHGHEGLTDDPHIIEQRQKAQQFAIMLTALAQGTPLLMSGNLRGHTQHGNNNTYAQDNELTWLRWTDDLKPWQKNMMELAARTFGFREAHPALRRQHAISGKDVTWWHPQGRAMQDTDWQQGQSFGMVLHGNTDRGKQDNAILMLINGSNQECSFTVPPIQAGERWTLALDSANTSGIRRQANYEGNAHVTMPPRSMQVFEGGISRHTGLGTDASQQRAAQPMRK